ncbi:hypothetical protein HMPREF0742_01991 [Rothia aeria F0184]|uniref:Uncharacterized protein n=2 Tax=Rothia aeria TaxID=172042 RepID=U7V3K1_9MICC|nr:hypothetical protein [Rothia aeria]ERT65323.1 hypothetical protein HMPREF0742_01991 [Rothia aeria F0184]QXW91798.1 hypothetical protein LPB401_06945 [Rothia aeria]
MTTDENLSKPEHGIIQSQDVHEIEKEPETDSVEKQNLFPPSLITVQIIRTALELILVVLLLPLLSNPLVLILFLPFGLYFVLQAVAWSRAEKETRLAWVRGTNVYSLLIVAPLGAFYTLFVIETSVPNADVQPLWWMLGACVLEAIMSIFMIVTITVIKRKYPHAFQDKRVTVAKPRIYDDALNGSPGKAYELGDESESLKKHHEDLIVEIPWQYVNVRSQKKD